jgi:hypothetical protein
VVSRGKEGSKSRSACLPPVVSASTQDVVLRLRHRPIGEFVTTRTAGVLLPVADPTWVAPKAVSGATPRDLGARADRTLVVAGPRTSRSRKVGALSAEALRLDRDRLQRLVENDCWRLGRCAIRRV